MKVFVVILFAFLCGCSEKMISGNPKNHKSGYATIYTTQPVTSTGKKCPKAFIVYYKGNQFSSKEWLSEDIYPYLADEGEYIITLHCASYVDNNDQCGQIIYVGGITLESKIIVKANNTYVLECTSEGNNLYTEREWKEYQKNK